MSKNAAVNRITAQHLRKKASRGDESWFAHQIELALELLKDACDVVDAGGFSDENPAIGRASNEIRRNISRDLGKLADDVKRSLGRRASAKTAAPSKPLDNRTKAQVNRAFTRHGLDGNTYYAKAEHGYAKAVEIMGQFGIELDGIPNSMEFTRPSGRVSVDLAWTNQADPFSPTPISNSMLVVTFHKMDKTGRFEVIAYLS